MTSPILAGLTADDVRHLLAGVEADMRRAGPVCGVVAALLEVEAVDPEAAEVLRVAFESDALPAGRLSETCAQLGVSVSEFSIGRHRRALRGAVGRSGCSCKTGAP
ncbi:MAG: hypothetical protein ACRCYR_03790 [Phycicoccus sp.]